MKKIVFLSVLSLTLLTGCPIYGGGIIIDDGYSNSPYIPPAHGRPFHRYNYYPNAEIYFDIGRNTYFYLDSAGAWTFSVNLPLHLRSHLRNGYVEVEMEHDRPYLRHKYYRNKYRKNKKYKRQLNNGRRYDNDRKYRNEGILRQDRKSNQRQYKNERKYDERQHKNERKYDERKYKNERKYDERKFKNEQRYKYKENKARKKQEKYEKDDDDKKQNQKSRRNDLY